MEMVEGLNNRYLRRAVQENEDEMEGYRSRILQRNKVAGLLPVDKRYMDGECYLYYEVTGMRSLKEIFLKRKMKERDLDRLFESMEDTLQSMEAYLLKQGDLCLKAEYIMEETETGKWNFLYIPDYGGSQAEDMEGVAEFMLEHMDCSEEKAMERVYDFYSELLQNGMQAKAGEIARMWKRNQKDTLDEDKYTQTEKGEAVQPVEQEQKTEKLIRVEKGRKFGSRRWERKIYKVPYRGQPLTEFP